MQQMANSFISRKQLFQFSPILLLVIVFASGSVTVAADPLNIVLFVTDDQSPDTGCYGNDAIKTPHLDRLAEEGTRFDRAFCTTASCSASRSVILTGLFNHANGQYGHAHSYHHFKTKSTIKSLPMYLSDAGYRTVRVGKFTSHPRSFIHLIKC